MLDLIGTVHQRSDGARSPPQLGMHARRRCPQPRRGMAGVWRNGTVVPLFYRGSGLYGEQGTMNTMVCSLPRMGAWVLLAATIGGPEAMRDCWRAIDVVLVTGPAWPHDERPLGTTANLHYPTLSPQQRRG
jgi:hypothetical protein